MSKNILIFDSFSVINRWRPDPDIGNTKETHCRDGGSGEYMSLLNSYYYKLKQRIPVILEM